MSDLQCAATLYVLGPEADAPEQLPDEARVAAVWCAPSRRAQAAALAQRWGCSVRGEPGLDAPAWPPRPEDPYEAVADLHRGESVLVLPAHAYPGHAPGDRVQVRIDGDGRAVRVLP